MKTKLKDKSLRFPEWQTASSRTPNSDKHRAHNNNLRSGTHSTRPLSAFCRTVGSNMRFTQERFLWRLFGKVYGKKGYYYYYLLFITNLLAFSKFQVQQFHTRIYHHTLIISTPCTLLAFILPLLLLLVISSAQLVPLSFPLCLCVLCVDFAYEKHMHYRSSHLFSSQASLELEVILNLLAHDQLVIYF